MNETHTPSPINILSDTTRVVSIILEHERLYITGIDSNEVETLDGGWTGGVVLTDGRILEDHCDSLYGCISKLAAQVSESGL